MAALGVFELSGKQIFFYFFCSNIDNIRYRLNIRHAAVSVDLKNSGVNQTIRWSIKSTNHQVSPLFSDLSLMSLSYNQGISKPFSRMYDAGPGLGNGEYIQFVLPGGRQVQLIDTPICSKLTYDIVVAFTYSAGTPESIRWRTRFLKNIKSKHIPENFNSDVIL